MPEYNGVCGMPYLHNNIITGTITIKFDFVHFDLRLIAKLTFLAIFEWHTWILVFNIDLTGNLSRRHREAFEFV